MRTMKQPCGSWIESWAPYRASGGGGEAFRVSKQRVQAMSVEELTPQHDGIDLRAVADVLEWQRDNGQTLDDDESAEGH
jgi:hypothetical protein